MIVTLYLLSLAAGADFVVGCRAIDGDTLRCGSERIRLIGIDAPEMPGHCRRGRTCVAGDPFASKFSLGKAATGRLFVHRFGQDRYRRTLALVRGAKGDLSCWQLRAGQARYRAKWDICGRVNACRTGEGRGYG